MLELWHVGTVVAVVAEAYFSQIVHWFMLDSLWVVDFYLPIMNLVIVFFFLFFFFQWWLGCGRVATSSPHLVIIWCVIMILWHDVASLFICSACLSLIGIVLLWFGPWTCRAGWRWKDPFYENSITASFKLTCCARNRVDLMILKMFLNSSIHTFSVFHCLILRLWSKVKTFLSLEDFERVDTDLMMVMLFLLELARPPSHACCWSKMLQLVF